MKRNISYFSVLFFLVSVFFISTGARAQVQIDSFSPSAGWAGTDQSNGTLVTIKGSGFEVDRENNTVLFANGVQAKVHTVFPKDDVYDFEKAIGQSGTQDGGLILPYNVAIDALGNIYVANTGNGRIEVFDKSGQFVRNNFHGLSDPVSIVIDNIRNRIYVYDYDQPSSRLLSYTLTGGDPTAVASVETNPVEDPGFKVAVDEATGMVYLNEKKFDTNLLPQGILDFPDRINGIAFHQQSGTLLVMSSRPSGTYVSHFNGDELTSVIDIIDIGVQGRGLAVDFKGDLYISSSIDSTFVIKKFDGSNGNLISTIGEYKGPPGMSVDSDTKVYAPTTNGYIKVFSPSGSDELIVSVPPGAVKGLIKVNTPTGAANTARVFTIFDNVGDVSFKKFEVTQGLETYPLIQEKETLMFVRMHGRFGHPSLDDVKFSVIKKGDLGFTYTRKPDEIRYNLRLNETTIIHHVPTSLLKEGEYDFSVRAKRGTNVIAEQAITRPVYDVKGMDLLFVKFTNVPEEGWSTVPPFSWFDTNRFLHGVQTLKRIMPVDPNELTYRVHNARPTDLVIDLSERDNRFALERKVDNIRVEYINSNFKPRRAVGLIDKDRIGNSKLLGWAGEEIAMTFFTELSWGRVLSHELGHTFGQVPEDKPNYVEGDHSINLYLDQDKGQPITTWNSITDELKLGDQVYSVMVAGDRCGAGDWQVFFESQFSGLGGDVDLEYRTLFDKWRTDKSIQPFSVQRFSSEKQFVITGSINEGGNVDIETSFVTSSEEEPTPSVRSDLKLVFLDSSNQILADVGFRLQHTYDDPEADSAGGLFSLAHPLPEATARIEIRLQDQVLAAVVPSPNPPVVSDVKVHIPEFGFAEIKWNALDSDGDELRYVVRYSTDGGQTYVPIAVGVSENRIAWDHSATGGSTNAVVQVIAGDGFHRGSAKSAILTVPGKVPIASILTPKAGAKILEGSTITLRATAIDPEDGVLSDEHLAWEFDGVVLGSGEVMRIGERSVLTPAGPVMLPLELGFHQIVLIATDSSGAQSRVEIEIEIVADTDRDGKSDNDELQADSDPTDPLVYPSICGDGIMDSGEMCDDGNTVIGDGCDALCNKENSSPYALCQDRSVLTDPGQCFTTQENASINNGSFDPDGELVDLTQTPAGPYALGTIKVDLTVTDNQGASDSCSAEITVADEEAPSISCNAPMSITPVDAPITFVASANDNCEATVQISEFDCYALTKKGKRIDKTGSCVVQLGDGMITILDSGGVGDNISWIVHASDSSGNKVVRQCSVTVVKP